MFLRTTLSGALLLCSSCIIVKETVPYEPPKDALLERVERLERREARSAEGHTGQRLADGMVGTVKAISAPGGVLVLDLKPGNSVGVGTQLAIIGREGFKGLVVVEERFEETSVSARFLNPANAPVSTGDHVLIALGIG